MVAATTVALAAILWGLAHGIYGDLYFLNYQKNFLGAVVGNCLVLLVGYAFYEGRVSKKLAAAILINAVASAMASSFGAILGVVAGVVIILMIFRRIPWWGALLAALSGAWLVWTHLLSGAGTFALGSDAYSAVTTRVVLFQDFKAVLPGHWWIGSGLNSFLAVIPQISFEQHDPNNVFMLNIAQGGVVGAGLFLMLTIVVVRSAIRTVAAAKKLQDAANRRRQLGITAMLAGAATAEFAHMQVDVSWVRGSGLFLMACVGMLLCQRSVMTPDDTAAQHESKVGKVTSGPARAPKTPVGHL